MRILLGLVALFLLSFAACTATEPTTVTASTAEWNREYDAEWLAMTSCWGVEPDAYPKPRVTVRAEAHDFRDPWNRLVHGYFEAPDNIVVAQDLRALTHEISEYLCYQISGAYCVHNRSGCSDVMVHPFGDIGMPAPGWGG